MIRDRPLLRQVSRQAKAHLLATSGDGALPPALRDMLESEAFDIFYGAPVLMLLSCPADEAFGIVDCALAAQNLMLSARALGLGTCWIGFASAWLAGAEGRRSVGLPESQMAVAPIIVGYPRLKNLPQVPRREPEIRWIG